MGKIVCIEAKWFSSGKSGCIRAKWLYSGKVVLFGQGGYIWAKWLFSEKVVVLGQSGCNRAKVVLFGQKLLYSGKVVVFGQSGCIRAKWLYSGKVVVFGQSGCIRARLLNSGKEVVYGQKWLYSDKVLVLGQKWLYLVKSGISIGDGGSGAVFDGNMFLSIFGMRVLPQFLFGVFSTCSAPLTLLEFLVQFGFGDWFQLVLTDLLFSNFPFKQKQLYWYTVLDNICENFHLNKINYIGILCWITLVKISI